MGRLALLLLFTVSFSTALLVLVDSSNCVHIRCQWRGEGEHCKPSLSLREAYKRDRCGLAFEFLYKDEADADLIRRIKSTFPLNTFTIDNVAMDEECETKKKLCCNVARADVSKDYSEYFEYRRSPGRRNLPRRLCSVQSMPYAV